MSKFQPGEIVDITIKGARVAALTRRGEHDVYLAFEYGGGENQHYRTGLRVDALSVTVERVAPAEWPPQRGDLWRDRRGELHFCTDAALEREGDQALVGEDGTDRWASGVLCDRGPLTLVRREGGAA